MPRPHPLAFISLVVVALCAGSMTLLPSSARACTCAPPDFVVTPRDGSAAPINTVVRVAFKVGQQRIDESTLLLHRTGRDLKPVGSPVRVDVKAITSGEWRTVTLRPRVPLSAASRYEIRAGFGPGKIGYVIGQFTTTVRADDEAPAWRGIRKSTYWHQEAVCCDCSTDDPYLQIDLAERTTSGGDAVLYGVWPDPRPGKMVDTAVAPVAFLEEHGGKLFLGRESRCSPNNFSFPADTNATGTGRILTFWIAPIDLADRPGEAESVTFEVTPQKPKPRR